MVIKYAGAAYLSWLGVGLLRSGLHIWKKGHQKGSETENSDATVDSAKPLRTALLISLMNPKAILFFVSFFIQFVSPDYSCPALSFLILGAIVQVCSALYLSLLIFGGAHLALQFERHRRLSASATGGGRPVIGFGIKLACATLG